MDNQTELKRTAHGVSIPDKGESVRSVNEVRIPGTNKIIRISRCPCCTAIQTRTQPCLNGDMVKAAFKVFATQQGFKGIDEFGLKDTPLGLKIWGARLI